MVILIIILILTLLFILKHHFKVLKLNNVVLINGGVKSGKTTLAVYYALKEHRKALIGWYINKYFFFKKNAEKPLLYSNVPIKYKYYIPLDEDTLLRKKRFAYKSVILWSEASLIADSMSFKNNDELNEQLCLFAKLIAHETKGGKLFIETQALSDLHYAIKRVLNNYVYIHSCIKWIPFVIVFKVREMLYSYDNQGMVNNAFNEDIEESTKTLIVPKSIWKKFDCYTYSVLTDSLDYDCCVLTKKELEQLNLKSDKIISFNHYKNLKKEGVKK